MQSKSSQRQLVASDSDSDDGTLDIQASVASKDDKHSSQSEWKYLLWHLFVMNVITISTTFVDASFTLLIPLYATNTLLRTETFAGILTSIQGLGNTLFNPLAGKLVAHTSCELAMILTLLLRVFVTLAMYFCAKFVANASHSQHNWWLASFLVFAVMCVLYGVTQSLANIARSTYISMHVPTRQRGRFTTYNVCFRRLSFAFAPLLSGVLAHAYSIPTAILFNVCWCAVSFCLCLILFIPPRFAGANTSGHLSLRNGLEIGSCGDFRKVFALVGLQRFRLQSWFVADTRANNSQQLAVGSSDEANGPIQTISMRDVLKTHFKILFNITLFSFGLKYARRTRKLILTFQAQKLGFDEDRIGYVNTYGYIPDFLMFFVAGNVMDRCGRKWTAVPSLLLFIVSLSCVSFAAEYGWLVMVSIMFGFADGISIGLLMTIGADIAPDDCRAQFLGFYRMASTSADVVAPLVVGYLSSDVSIFWAAASAAMVAVFSLIWIVFFVSEPAKFKANVNELSQTAVQTLENVEQLDEVIEMSKVEDSRGGKIEKNVGKELESVQEDSKQNLLTNSTHAGSPP